MVPVFICGINGLMRMVVIQNWRVYHADRERLAHVHVDPRGG